MVAEHLVAFLGAEDAAFSSQQLRDGGAVRREQRVGRLRVVTLRHREDEVVLGEEVAARPCDRAGDPLDERRAEALGALRKRRPFS